MFCSWSKTFELVFTTDFFFDEVLATGGKLKLYQKLPK